MPIEEYKIFNMQVAKLEGFEFLLQVTIFLLKLTPLALQHHTKRSHSSGSSTPVKWKAHT